MSSKMSFGQTLVQKKIITQQQLKEAEKIRQTSGEKIGRILVAQGGLTEEVFLKNFAEYLNMPFVDLKYFNIQPELTKQLTESYARYFQAIILEQHVEGFLVGMVDPSDMPAVDELKRVLNKPLKLAVVSERDLRVTLDLVYRHADEIQGFAEQLDEELSEGDIDLETLSGEEEGRMDATVIKLLQTLFRDAVQANASDIHIEPEERILRIRLRIDGVLHEQIVEERMIASAMALRLKLMAGLNITEKRLPQEGRFNIKAHKKTIDVRLSLLPTQYGESVTMRLLDQETNLLSLKEIGMTEEILKRFYDLLNAPYGMMLVTGPTGCGKTTTLYGVLKYLNVPEKKIITVEDPVEYRLPRINQSQVRPQLGLTFASISRVILRHDPDIIMVGEMRDEETSSIGVRAALTGHLVLTTLHTNDAASSALRLLDMDVDGYLVAATLRGIIAQRLVRRICDSCKDSCKLNSMEANWVQAQSNKAALKALPLKRGKGCAHCNQTGYKGRVGIFELLELNQEMRDDLSRNDPAVFMAHAATALKGKTLLDSGLECVKQGVTTLSEVIRVAGTY